MNEAAVEAPLILVVDDNPLNVEPLSELLQAMGYRTQEALDGRAALDRVRADPPDLILLDVMMPGMNGYEVCEKLKSDPDPAIRRIPIVFVTALSETEDKLRGIDVGADDFLTKPFNRPILLARVRSLLRLKAARDEVEQSYRKLQTMERLRDDLMKMIVHDLKSPLTSVLGTLEMAVDGDLGPVTDEQRRLFADAYERGGDALQLMEDLLELTRLEDSELQLDLRVLDAGELLDAVASEWSVRAERNGAILNVEAEQGVRVEADEHMIRRVFSNLIGNAILHAGDEVNIVLSATRMADDSQVRFTVKDDGRGIPPAHFDTIFRKFGSIRRGGSRPSSGLGLTFCKLAVEAHGGRIWVESPQSGGSRFHFTLPEPAGSVPQEQATIGLLAASE